MVSLGILGLAKKGTSKLAKYTKNIKLSGSLTREEIVGIFMRLEKGGSIGGKRENYFIRVTENKYKLDLLWKRISTGSKFIEKRSVPITNKKTKITTREDITMHKLDDGRTHRAASAGGRRWRSNTAKAKMVIL